MDFNRRWTEFALDAEVEHFGTSRIAKAHNDLMDKLANLERSVEVEVEVDATNFCPESIREHSGRTCVCGVKPKVLEWPRPSGVGNLFQIKCRCGRHTIESTACGDVQKLWDYGYEIYNP